MAVTALFPRGMEEKLGKETTEEFINWLDAFIKEKGVTRDEYREILSRLDKIDKDLEGIKEEQGRQRQDIGQLRQEINDRFDRFNEQMNERFDRINDRFDRMNNEFNDRLDRMNNEMNERFDRMNNEMNERFDRMNNEMNERFDRINDRLDRMNERLQSAIKWMVGVTLGMGSLLAVLMSIYKFMG